MKSNSKTLLVAIFVASLVTASAAVLHGRLSNRWGTAPDSNFTLEFVQSLPRTVGDWQVVDETPLDSFALETLQCASYANRIYAHRRTGDQLAVTLLAGPPGPMTVHTAEICMTTRNFKSMGEPDRAEFQSGDSTARFYRSAFRSTSPAQPSVEVFYGWSQGGKWDAPDAPRFAYGGAPMLLKLQVVSTIWPNVATGNDGLAARFLKELLTVLPREFGERSSVTTSESPL